MNMTGHLCIVLIGWMVLSSPSSGSPIGQQERVLIDEVIARVNSDIITLSTYRRAQTEIRQELQQSGLNGQQLEQAYEQATKNLLQQLIDNQLLVQKANELGINVESQINEFVLNWCKQQNIPPADCERRLSEAGLDPDQVRQTLRMRFQREAVLSREVYSRIFQNIFDRDIEEYYTKHLDEFAEPETVRLSEIFVPFTERTRAQAEQTVREIMQKLREGADFGELAERYSSRPSAKMKGDIGTFTLGPQRTLGDAQTKAIEGKGVGQVTDPIQLSDGFQILKVMDRRERTVKPLDAELKRRIQMRIVQERAEPAVTAYIENLRKDAYIWVAPDYRDQVAALAPAETKEGKSSKESKPQKK